MKNLLLLSLLCVSIVVNAQKGKPSTPVTDVYKRSDSLFKIKDGVEQFICKLENGVMPPFTGIFKDANGNVDISDRGGTILTGNNYNNLIFGENADLRGVNKVAVLCTDCIFYPGANYSVAGGGRAITAAGDAGHVSGYSSTSFGYFYNNHMEAGVNIGVQNTLGKRTEPNKYFRSAAIGAYINLQESDIFMFGYGSGANTEWSKKGAFLTYGTYKFGLLPNGKLYLNGVEYTPAEITVSVAKLTTTVETQRKELEVLKTEIKRRKKFGVITPDGRLFQVIELKD
jgi:hypothetical protein